MSRTSLTAALALTSSVPHAAAATFDHTCAELDQVPNSWIEAVQDDIQSHYAHTSHGSQLTWGLSFIEDDDPFYDCEIGDCYLPSTAGAWCIFNGQEGATYITPDMYWETGSGMDMTRAVLDNNPELDTSMWCWCSQCNYYSEAQVQAYLDSMAVLEAEYPGVTFIYFTGNAQGTGSEGYNRWQRNQQIRQYCQDNDRVLYDFADLDCWWFNPSTSQWEQHTYEYNGQDIPAEHPEFYGDEYGHTTAESCRQKGEALWWMMAVLAGWQGSGVAEGERPTGYRLSVDGANPCPGTAHLTCTLPEPGRLSLGVYGADGRLRARPLDGDAAAGQHTAQVSGLPAGVYTCVMQSGDFAACERLVVLP
jgi:hypothetical protein